MTNFVFSVVQRSNSSPNIHSDSTKSDTAQSKSEPSSINLLKPNNRLHASNHPKVLPSQCKNCKKSTITPNAKDTVKMWFMKSLVQVRLPSSFKKGYACNGPTKSTLVPRCELTTPSSEQCSYNGNCHSDEANYATSSVDETTYHFARHGIRSNYMDKSIEAKKKVN